MTHGRFSMESLSGVGLGVSGFGDAVSLYPLSRAVGSRKLEPTAEKPLLWCQG